MSLYLVQNQPSPAAEPKVLNPDFNARLTALNHAERSLTHDFGLTVLDSRMAGQLPTITVQFMPGKMSRLLNVITDRSQHETNECVVVSGRFGDVRVFWAVPQ